MPAIPDLAATAMGGTLVNGGATFRVWAPRAKNVYVCGPFNSWKQNPNSRLQPIGGGHWAGYVAGLKDGDQYLFYVDGIGSEGYKRDPRARFLTFRPAFPFSNCVLRDSTRFPWHGSAYRFPDFRDLILCELHVGTYSIASGSTGGRFLDVALKLPYLVSLGITAIELLPIQEFETEFSLGYNGTDFYNPEDRYAEADENKLQICFEAVNRLLTNAGKPPYAGIDVLRGSDNQLRVLIDVCHVFGIGVLLDVVYNHAGGGFDDNSMYFLDRMPRGNDNDSLYFTDQGLAGGKVFAFWNNDVQQLLVDNAAFLCEEYRIDGLRFDEVSVMDRFGGWHTCQSITGTVRFLHPDRIQIAEYWPVNGAVVSPASSGGAGFDVTWNDRLRNAVRSALSAASNGASSFVNMDAIAGAIMDSGIRDRWRSVQSLENHDLVYRGRGLRIPPLADGSNARSWYARSRSRVAMGVLLTAPGIPMLFMGQEFLEDKQWNDTPDAENLIWWAGLGDGDKTMGDFLRFTRELIMLRRNQPAFRGEGCAIIHTHNDNRVLVFQRWVEGQGNDVVVVVSLNEGNLYNYPIGFPTGGRWTEAFNSDVYDNWVNPLVVGNGGGLNAEGPPLHGLSTSASVLIPANSLLVFVRN